MFGDNWKPVVCDVSIVENNCCIKVYFFLTSYFTFLAWGKNGITVYFTHNNIEDLEKRSLLYIPEHWDITHISQGYLRNQWDNRCGMPNTPIGHSRFIPPKAICSIRCNHGYRELRVTGAGKN